MKCKEITDLLEELSPPAYAADWDNIGLMVGSYDAEIHKVLITLDGDENALDRAQSIGADLIITHHPLIFGSLKSVTDADMTGKRIIKLIQNGINLYSMHTNFDVMGGMAEAAADRIGIQNRRILEEVRGQEGFGRVGDYPFPLSVGEWAERIKQLFGLPHVILYGKPERIVNRIAIVPGSGKDFIGYALKEGAQLYITGDISHHSGIDANALGLEVIDAGHYGIEHIFISFIAEYLKKHIPQGKLEIICMDKKIPFQIL